MNRRVFVSSSGASAAAFASILSGPASGAPPQHAMMKLGCQSAPTSEPHLAYLARYGVQGICGYPEITDGRLYATADELNRIRELAERYRISVDCIAPPFLSSSHIDREKHPAIMLAQSPQRDRDIEGLQALDIAIALGALRQHYGRVLFTVDVTRRQERGRNAVDADAVPFSQFPDAVEFICGCIEASVGDFWIAADTLNAIACQIREVRLAGGRALAAQLHHGVLGRSPAGGSGQNACERRGRGSRRRDEYPAIHCAPFCWQNWISPNSRASVPLWSRSF